MKKIILLFLFCLGITSASFAVGPIVGPSSVCVGSTITLSDTTLGGGWLSSNTAVATIGSLSGILTGISAGVTNISYLSSSGIAVMAVTVNPLPAPISGTLSICVGQTTALTDSPPGGIWASSAPAIATVGATTGVATGVSAGTATIIYTLSTGCSRSAILSVNPNPAAITGSLSVCVGFTTVLANTSPGGIWTSSAISVATVGSTTGLVTGVSLGTSNIMYTFATGCHTTAVVTVAAIPTPITGSLVICSGASSTLSSTPAGGTWLSGSTSIATIGLTSGIATGFNVGTSVITYTTAAGCSRTAVATVNPTPSITGPATVCIGSVTTLVGSPAGGTWTSSLTGVATVGLTSGIVTPVAAGATTISYFLSGCPGTKVVNVVGVPSAITGPSTVCAGSTITLTDTASGGTWSSSSPTIATVGSSTGVVTGVGAGVATITFSLGGSCLVTKAVTVTAAPAAISGPGSVCVGSTMLLSDVTPGGTWSSSNPAVASVNTAGIVTGNTAGTATITYSIGTSCIVTRTVSVFTTPAAITGPTRFCAGSTITLSDATPGGHWSSANTSVAIIDSTTGLVTGITAGVVNLFYTIGSCSVFRTDTVIAAPSPISGPNTVCVGTTITLTDATTGGTWTSSNTAIAAVGATTGVVTAVAAGVVTITYGVGTSCIATKTVSVTAAPAAIAGSSTLCVGSTITLTDATAGGIWTSSTPSVATVGSTTGVVTGVGAGITSITYTLASGCRVNKIVTVSAAPTAITGAGAICIGATLTLSNATPGGVWSSSNVAVATVGSTSGVVTGVAAGVASITYSTGTGCSATASVTVNASPATITGANALCVGGSTTLSVATTLGTWSSSSTAIATVSTTGVVTAVSAGVVTISYTKNGCSATKTMTVTAVPTAIVGASTLCSGSTTTFTDAVAGGTWSSSNVAIATVGVSTGIVTGVAAGLVRITYKMAGGCYTVKQITITAGPAAIGGPSTVCVGSSITLTDATSGGTWSGSSGFIATVGATGVVTGVSAGVVTVTYTKSGCSVTKTVSVNATSPITGGNTVCVGSTLSLASATPGGVWSSSSTAIASVTTSGVVTGTAAGVVTIYYTAGGCSVQKSVTVTTSTSAITGSSSLCTGTTITLANATPGGVWSSSNPLVATISPTGVVSGLSIGAATITYAVGGCFATKNITVSTAPTPISGPISVCVGGTILLTDGTPGGVWLSSDLSVATVAATGIVTGVSVGITVIYYTAGSCGNVKKSISVVDCVPTGGKAKGANGSMQVGNSEGSINLFPNPTSGNITISWDDQPMNGASVAVTDMLGREVSHTVISNEAVSGDAHLNLSNLKDGIYMISIKSENVNFTSRVSVRH